MEYPQTVEEAVAELNGYWKTELENKKLSLVVQDQKITDIQGLNGSMQQGNHLSLPFAIDYDFIANQWQLTSEPIFGTQSNIVDWDEGSFTIYFSKSGLERKFVRAD